MYTLEELQMIIKRCNRCPLSKSRTNTVFGEGNTEAKMMFVGEGPGFNEDRLR
jgi:uracil-DNA glycosylase family 4